MSNDSYIIDRERVYCVAYLAVVGGWRIKTTGIVTEENEEVPDQIM
jgi:hypothetical protein